MILDKRKKRLFAAAIAIVGVVILIISLLPGLLTLA